MRSAWAEGPSLYIAWLKFKLRAEHVASQASVLTWTGLALSSAEMTCSIWKLNCKICELVAGSERSLILHNDIIYNIDGEIRVLSAQMKWCDGYNRHVLMRGKRDRVKKET